MGSTNARTTSIVACHHHLWALQTIERHWAVHDITAFGLHARSDDVRRGMTSPSLDYTHGWTWHVIIAFGKHTRLNDVGRGMTSTPLDSTYDQTTSGVTCHHRLCKAHTFQRRQVWLDITLLGLHARLDDVGRGMTSPPYDSTHGRQRRAWHDITAL